MRKAAKKHTYMPMIGKVEKGVQSNVRNLPMSHEKGLI